MPPRVLLLRAPGTNCDQETAYAFEQVGAQSERLHVNRLLAEPGLLDNYQILCIAGGFSYGDDLAAGRILGAQLRSHLAEPLARFKDAGKLILGICNGFQVLMNTGLLLDEVPPGDGGQPHCPAALTFNDSGRFEDRWIHLRASGNRCVLLAGVETMYLPIAHAEGKFVARDEATLRALEQAGQLALRYHLPGATSNGELLAYPHNPNGSMANVAGLCDATGRVLGLMPHPERHIDPTQHPHWTRRNEQPPEGDGLVVFRNAVNYFR